MKHPKLLIAFRATGDIQHLLRWAQKRTGKTRTRIISECILHKLGQAQEFNGK
jgi:predicted DNA-binding protein